MKEKATIYDLWRICKNYVGNCTDCPLKGKICTLGSGVSTKEVDEINEIILKWRKEHPVKTRQDKFLEMFPNAIKDNGIIDICPLVVESGYECLCKAEPITDCNICRSKYWLAEVEDDE